MLDVEIGVETGTETGVETGVESGVETGVETGIETGAKAGVEMGGKTDTAGGVLTERTGPGGALTYEVGWEGEAEDEFQELCDQEEEYVDGVPTEGSWMKIQPVLAHESEGREIDPASECAPKTQPNATTPQPRRIHAVITNLPVQYRERKRRVGQHRSSGWVFL